MYVLSLQVQNRARIHFAKYTWLHVRRCEHLWSSVRTGARREVVEKAVTHSFVLPRPFPHKDFALFSLIHRVSHLSKGVLPSALAHPSWSHIISTKKEVMDLKNRVLPWFSPRCLLQSYLKFISEITLTKLNGDVSHTQNVWSNLKKYFKYAMDL